MVLHLHALWRQGAREDDAVRPAVQQAMGLGLAAATVMALHLGYAPTTAGQAAEMDRVDRFWRRFWQVVWALVVLLAAWMIGTPLLR